MVCSFCAKDTDKFDYYHTSHREPRPLCYKCIGDRDLRTMNEGKTIILYREANKIANATKTIAFKIIEEKTSEHSKIIYFLYNKKRWEGIQHNNCDRIYCKKIKCKK